MKKNSNILIFGSGGFVGGSLKRNLINDGFTNITCPSRSDVDLRYDVRIINDLCMSHEYVFMCAAKVGGIQANIDSPYEFLMDNLMIQNNVINACVNSGSKTMFLGSSCIYPKDYRQPLSEEDLLAAPLEPTNEGYALAKITGLKACEYANKSKGSNIISLMPCNLFGPGDNYNLGTSHVLGALINKIYNAHINSYPQVEIWGDGTQRREFLYINDLIDGIIWSVDNIDKTDTFLNIGTGMDISITDLAHKIKEIIGYEGDFYYNTDKPNGMMRKCLDINKIKSMGWEPITSLDDALKETINSYIREHNERRN